MRIPLRFLTTASTLWLCACPPQLSEPATKPAPDRSAPSRSAHPACYDEVFGGEVDAKTPEQLLEAGRYTALKGSLMIHNTQLVEVPPLACLREVEHLHIDLSPKLQSLIGLESITTVRANLNLGTTEVLPDLHGLGNITSVGNQLFISNNRRLKTLAGLGRLERVGSGLYVTYNDALEDLHGLNKLQHVKGMFNLSENPALKELVGLSSLQRIGGNFSITSNGALFSLRGITRLQYVGGDVYVHGCPRLPDCELLKLLKQLRKQRPELKFDFADTLADECTAELERLSKQTVPD